MNVSDIRKQLEQNYAEQRKLIALLEQNLGNDISHHNNPKPCKQVLFNEKLPVPRTLRDLLGLPKKDMTRAEVTRHFYQYLKEHDLIDKSKRRIKMDQDLHDMFGDTDLTFYNLQQHINTLYD